jgi:DNA-binding NtrC family response regulator
MLTLPPLRERPADIPLLWEHFTLLHGGPGVTSEPELLEALARLAWRGNVRELKNVNQRLVLMRGGDTLTVAALRELAPHAGGVAPAAATGTDDDGGGLPLGPLPPGGLSLVELEKEVIRRALALCGGNRSRTANYLSIPRHILLYRLNKYDLD